MPAQDLYVPPQEAEPGRLEAAVRGRASDAYDFRDALGFPVYHRTLKEAAAQELEAALAPKLGGAGRAARPVRSRKLRELAAAAAVDFAHLSLAPGSSPELQHLASRLQSAVAEVRGAADARAAVQGAAALGAGPYLTGLYLVRGSARICLSPARPDTLDAWSHGPLGAVAEVDAQRGSLLLFHRAAQLLDCDGAAGQDTLWVAFHVWFRSPLAEDAGAQEGNLRFKDPPYGSSFVHSALGDAPAATKTVLWPMPVRVVRFHYPSAPAFGFLKRLEVGPRGPWPPPGGAPGDPLWCPTGFASPLDLQEAAGLREGLLRAAAAFLAERLGRPVTEGDLAVVASSLCMLSDVRLDFPLPARGLLRGAYVAEAAAVYGPGERMPVRIEVARDRADMGARCDGLESALDWPFAPVPQALSPRLPLGAALLVPASARLSVLPLRGSGIARLLLFDVAWAHAAEAPTGRCRAQSVPLAAAAPADVRRLFPTAVHSQQLGGAEELVKRLRATVLASAKAHPSAHLSNVGGWQSPADWLMTEESTALASLRGELMDFILSALLSELPAETVADLDLRVTGWANVNRRNHSNALHHHSDLDWRLSGV